MFEQFRGFMRKLGYPRKKIKLRTASTFADYIKSVNEGDYDMFGLGWVPGIPDPMQLLERYSSRHFSPGSNKSMFSHPEYDRLYDQVRTMESGPERAAKVKRMNQLLVDQCTGIESFSRVRLHVWHRNVKMNYTQNLLRGLFKYIAVADQKISH